MLRQIVLQSASPLRTANFFRDVLGFSIKHSSVGFVEVDCVPPIVVMMESAAAASPAAVPTSSGPILTFTVQDMNTCVPRALSLGATLDGSIQHKSYGIVAALRVEGTVIGLFQAEPSVTTK